MKKSAVFTIGVLLAISCYSQVNEPVKNIILLIGDGMGVAQVYAGYTANKGQLNLQRSQYSGFSITYSSSDYITDSGAGATAIATGKKTYNGAIGVDSEGMPVKTILETARDKGFGTGLVATCDITHATPASFVAHDTSRNDYEAIAMDFVGSGIDLFIGGGRDRFEKRSDSVNVSDMLREKGYSVTYSLDSLKGENEGKAACMVADVHLLPVLQGRGNYLPEATSIALNRLAENKNGFFIMIEGSQIDWGGHANNLDYIKTEMVDFDKAVGVAFDFADKNPGTLVIVTADHETGGLALVDGSLETGAVTGAFGTTNHTAVMVPVFSYGTGAALFAGMYQNTDIYYKMLKVFETK